MHRFVFVRVTEVGLASLDITALRRRDESEQLNNHSNEIFGSWLLSLSFLRLDYSIAHTPLIKSADTVGMGPLSAAPQRSRERIEHAVRVTDNSIGV